MSTISTNPTLRFVMPGGGVNLTPVFEHPYLKITPAGAVSGTESLKSLPAGAVSLVIPEYLEGIRVTSISDKGFIECESLSSIDVPESLISIGYMAFDDCLSLREISFYNGITSIGEEAFGNCMAMVSIIIPKTVVTIGPNAFKGCYSMFSCKINKPKDSISGAPWGCPDADAITWK